MYIGICVSHSNFFYNKISIQRDLRINISIVIYNTWECQSSVNISLYRIIRNAAFYFSRKIKFSFMDAESVFTGTRIDIIQFYCVSSFKKLSKSLI